MVWNSSTISQQTARPLKAIVDSGTTLNYLPYRMCPFPFPFLHPLPGLFPPFLPVAPSPKPWVACLQLTPSKKSLKQSTMRLSPAPSGTRR